MSLDVKQNAYLSGLLGGAAANEVINRIVEGAGGSVTVLEPTPRGISKPVNVNKFRISAGPEAERDYGAHGALDIQVTKGTGVKAVGDGSVIYVEDHAGKIGKQNNCGCMIKISHSPPIELPEVGGVKTSITTSLYCHLSKISVRKGETVSAGQDIGRSGGGTAAADQPCAGRTSGPHLHLGLDGTGKAADRYGAYILALTGAAGVPGETDRGSDPGDIPVE